MHCWPVYVPVPWSTTRFVYTTNLATAYNHARPWAFWYVEHLFRRSDNADVLYPTLLKIYGVDTRREHKLTAGTPKNEHPCSFLGCQFAEANWLLLETTAVHGGSDTLRINLCAATKEIPLQPALLKIDGTDARSLAEIKRMRICDTLSIYFGVATTQMCRIQRFWK